MSWTLLLQIAILIVVVGAAVGYVIETMRKRM